MFPKGVPLRTIQKENNMGNWLDIIAVVILVVAGIFIYRSKANKD